MSLWSRADYEKALTFLKGRGFVALFASGPGMSFYRWVREEIRHGDPEKDFVLAWELSNLMSDGKLFKDYLLIDIGFLPVFLAVYQVQDARELYWSGNLSRKAWEVFGLLEEGPRTTTALNQALSARDSGSRAEI